MRIMQPEGAAAPPEDPHYARHIEAVRAAVEVLGEIVKPPWRYTHDGFIARQSPHIPERMFQEWYKIWKEASKELGQ